MFSIFDIMNSCLISHVKFCRGFSAAVYSKRYSTDHVLRINSAISWGSTEIAVSTAGVYWSSGQDSSSSVMGDRVVFSQWDLTFCMVTWWRVNKASWLFLILKDWIINLKQNINKLVMISHAFSHSSYLMFFRNFIFRSYSFLQWNFQIWIKICRCFKVHIFLALGRVFIILLHLWHYELNPCTCKKWVLLLII